MNKGRLMIINMIGIIATLALVAVCGYYYYQNKHYVTTDEARVSANMTKITCACIRKIKRLGCKRRRPYIRRRQPRKNIGRAAVGSCQSHFRRNTGQKYSRSIIKS